MGLLGTKEAGALSLAPVYFVTLGTDVNGDRGIATGILTMVAAYMDKVQRAHEQIRRHVAYKRQIFAFQHELARHG